jgi:hypothetical protein
MGEYRLHDNLFLLPTPAGAYSAIAHRSDDPVRRLLCGLLREESTPKMTLQGIEHWTGQQNAAALESLYLAQQHHWIEGFEQPRQSPSGALETLLPNLLPSLADSGKVLLADSHGFYVASAGFTHEAAVELSALSADLASLDDRHGGLIHQNLRIDSSAWALDDAAGNSRLGFWPLFIHIHRFVLVLQGQPQFNQAAFTELVWALSTRYAERPQE